MLRSRSGTAAIEFAFIAPILIMLLLGILAFGFLFVANIAATQAASEGARAAVAGLDNAERQTLATSAATAVLTSYGGLAAPPRGTVTVPAPASGGTTITVTVNIDLTGYGISALPLFSAVLPIPTTATATVTTRIGSF